MAKKTNLHFTRVTGVLDLVAPEGCTASVLLKSVAGTDDPAGYVWWLSVGRYDDNALTMRFDCGGKEFIRCDVPEGFELSEKAIRDELPTFLTRPVLNGAGVNGHSPRIQGPSTGTGDGGTGPINPH